MSLSIDATKLTIPRGKAGDEMFVIDMTEVNSIEARIPEIRRSTPLTLPDLVTTFTIGLTRMSQIVALVDLETREAKRALEEARAVALLDKAEEALQNKKVKSSADTREAIVTIDPDVKKAREKFDILTATQSFLMSKQNAMEMAYHGAKKICDVFIKTPASGFLSGEGHES